MVKLDEKDLIKEVTSYRTFKLYKTQLDVLTIQEIITENNGTSYDLKVLGKPKGKDVYIDYNTLLTIDNYGEAKDLIVKFNYSMPEIVGHNTIYKSLVTNTYFPHTIKYGKKQLTLTDNEEIELFLQDPDLYIKNLAKLKVGLFVTPHQQIIYIVNRYVETTLPPNEPPVPVIKDEEFTLIIDQVNYYEGGKRAIAVYTIEGGLINDNNRFR